MGTSVCQKTVPLLCQENGQKNGQKNGQNEICVILRTKSRMGVGQNERGANFIYRPWAHEKDGRGQDERDEICICSTLL
jgi:hypothetical protein